MTAEEFFYAVLFLAVGLVVLAVTAVLQWADRRYPRLKAFLDRHVGPDPVWDR